jgi:hypothetical protein
MLSQVACEDSEELRALCRFAIFLEVLLKPCVVEDAIERPWLLNWDLGFVWCLTRLHSCATFFLLFSIFFCVYCCPRQRDANSEDCAVIFGMLFKNQGLNKSAHAPKCRNKLSPIQSHEDRRFVSFKRQFSTRGFQIGV